MDIQQGYTGGSRPEAKERTAQGKCKALLKIPCDVPPPRWGETRESAAEQASLGELLMCNPLATWYCAHQLDAEADQQMALAMAG